jgi:PAS domain S-box-containing protein
MTFPPEDRANGAPERELATARASGVAPDVRWHVRKDGTPIYIEGTTRALLDASGGVRGFLKVGQDVTERRATEQALIESEERFRHFADTSNDIIWIRNADSMQFEYVSPAFERVYGDSFDRVFSGNDLRRWLELVLPEDRDAVLDALRRVLAGEHVTHQFRITRPADGEVRWIRNSDFPLRDTSGRVHRIGGISHDSTEEKLSAERMGIMVAELQHRTRNLIAVVRSISDQTIRTTGDLAAFQEKFGERLAALARVQGLLSRSDEDPITLRGLIRAELAALGGGERDAGRIVLRGPPVRLRNKIVQTLALALHELATNARKYGALAGNDGRLEIVWSIETRDRSESSLMLTWTETISGEQPERPAGRGYGRHLIERALPYALGARTTYTLSATGVHCTIDLPLKALGPGDS